MSYTPTEWKSGDTVTSAKLNKIEQGIANNNIIIETCEYYEEEPDGYTNYLFKSVHTLTEIAEWCKAGKQVFFCFPNQHKWTWGKTEYKPIIGYEFDESDEYGIECNIMIPNSSSVLSATESSSYYISGMHHDYDTDLIIFEIYSPD